MNFSSAGAALPRNGLPDLGAARPQAGFESGWCPVSDRRYTPTCTHWGNFRIEVRDNSIHAAHPYPEDEEPSPVGDSLCGNSDARVRIPQPMVREGYLANPRRPAQGARGREPFVPLSWPRAIELTAQALETCWQTGGPNSIYGGSYGWASAGRFHHAQSQIHRFLDLGGGYVASVNSYSAAAAEVIIKHIIGLPLLALLREAPSPEEIAAHSQTMILFGGAAIKNSQVNSGGLGAHSARRQLGLLAKAGVKVINVSPIRDDALAELNADWVPCRPGSDTAVMLGMAYVLYTQNRHDRYFLEHYTVGFDRFLPYLLGVGDGVAKTPQWASSLSGIPAAKIEDMATAASAGPSLISISWSLQRQKYGEQTWWMATTLAAMLGFIGLPGCGIGYGYGCIHNMGFGGRKVTNFSIGAFSEEAGERRQPNHDFIPVARIADMLNHPGEPFDYNGRRLTYPMIDLVYWAGGNPFHHHQNLNELSDAWQKPGTVIVHDSVWTATARHADIVLPVNTFLERNDIGGSAYDHYLSPMPAAVPAFGKSKSDFEIFTLLAQRLGFAEKFTEGRDEAAWVAHLYDVTRKNAAAKGISLPDFETFWAGEQIALTDQLPEADYMLEKFRRDPSQHPLGTPSGKIEIFSETISSFDYDDCVGHPSWYDHDEWLGGGRAVDYPFHLVSNQPRNRLHSQLDHGITSQKHKISGRERARMNTTDALQLGLKDGGVIHIYNDRGSSLAGLEISDEIMPGVIELPTGAWFDPQMADGQRLEVHGNPNVLTPDVGTSRLAQGCSAHTCMVNVAAYDRELPPISIFEPPDLKPIT